MNRNPIVQVERITATEEYQPDGKKYKVRSCVCEGFIDGEPASDFIVKAIGKEKINALVPGLTFEAEVDERKHNGKTQYVIPKEFRGSLPRTSPTPAAPQAGRAQAGRPQAARQQGMSMEEFDELFRHAVDVVCSVDALPEDAPINDVQAKLVSTYIIAAMDNGIRPPRAEPPPEEIKVNFNEIIEILEKKGLTKRVEDAGIGEDELVNLWKRAGGSGLKFGMLVNSRLNEAEGNPTDEGVPF